MRNEYVSYSMITMNYCHLKYIHTYSFIYIYYSIKYNESYTDEIVKIKINTRVFVNPINNYI